RYLDVLQRLADLEMETRQYDAAARSYYRILEIEPFREAAHRGLMRYFAMRGEYARAIAQFQTCVREIGGAPAPQTATLHQTIVARSRANTSARSMPRALATSRASAS
ncbi:MAG: AfsR/SARP family transcriptional regulator, partial [Ktedonobacterales bacterium]